MHDLWDLCLSVLVHGFSCGRLNRLLFFPAHVKIGNLIIIIIIITIVVMTAEAASDLLCCQVASGTTLPCLFRTA